MRALILDSEATGVDPFHDRLVTLFVGIMEDDGTFSQENMWMFNPGVDIPEAAIEIHGITNEIVRDKGIAPDEHKKYLLLIRALIVDTARNFNIPVVAYNTTYDFTLLNAEFTRNDITVISWDDMFVLDPLVIDKQVDKWRKGGRTLVAVAAHYKVPVDVEKAHDAAYDCYLAGRILQALAGHPQLTGLTRSELHQKQKDWKFEQSASLEVYFRKKNGDPELVINKEWPVQFTK